MSDALEEFTRQTIAEILKKLPVEERLKGISTDEVLKVLSPAERLKGLSTEELLGALSPEARESLAQRLKGNGPVSHSE
jgi:hypothetical protein